MGHLSQQHAFFKRNLPKLVNLGVAIESEGKVSACNAGDLGSIPGLERSPEEGNGNPLQYSCLENPMDGGVWWATVHWVTKSRTQLSYFTFTFFILILKMEEKKQQFWHIMLDYVKKGKNTTDTKKKVLCRAWRRCCDWANVSKVFCTCQKSRAGDFSAYDAPQSGRPV